MRHTHIPGGIANECGGAFLSARETQGLDFALLSYYEMRVQRLLDGPTREVDGCQVPIGHDIDPDRWLSEESALMAIGKARDFDFRVSIILFGFVVSCFVLLGMVLLFDFAVITLIHFQQSRVPQRILVECRDGTAVPGADDETQVCTVCTKCTLIVHLVLFFFCFAVLHNLVCLSGRI